MSYPTRTHSDSGSIARLWFVDGCALGSGQRDFAATAVRRDAHSRFATARTSGSGTAPAATAGDVAGNDEINRNVFLSDMMRLPPYSHSTRVGVARCIGTNGVLLHADEVIR